MSNEVRMPSYRVGKNVRYANWDHAEFRPGDEVGYDVWFDQFRNQYWRRRRDAQAWLDAAKARWSAAAEAGAAFIAATDPALGERILHHEVSQEDFRLPYYKQVWGAAQSLERWKWGRDFVIGDWEESSSVTRLNLLSDDPSDTAKERLEIMCRTSDGFEIAEKDFALRGAGELIGTRQHGQGMWQWIMELGDAGLLGRVRSLAHEVMEMPVLENNALAEAARDLYMSGGDPVAMN